MGVENNNKKTMNKNIFKSLLAIFCLLCSANASAYDFEVDGIYYDVVSLTEFTCKVVKENDKSLYRGDIVIPEKVNYNGKELTVVEIADRVFNKCSDLTSISIPKTISSISDYMFSGCSALEHVKFEDGETILELGRGSSASNGQYYGLFTNCPVTSLYLGRDLSYNRSLNGYYYGPFMRNKTIQEVIIGDSVTEISKYMFYQCSELTDITFGKFVTKIDENAFEECGLTSIEIPNSVTEIGSYAFYQCWNMVSATIPNSITKIADYMFYNCPSLTNVTIPNSVTEIGSVAFCVCSSLTSIVIPNSVTDIGSLAFDGCKSLTNVEIPNSVTKINYSTFEDCINLTSVALPNSITSIDNSAFSGCKNLTNIIIPNSVTEIGTFVFFKCSSLVSITIGNSVTTIGKSTFNGCNELTTLFSLNTTPPNIDFDNFTNNQYMTLNVYVPHEAVEAYQSTEPWKNFWNLQSDPTKIENVKTKGENPIYYDLQGNKLDAPKRGLNIINGKKVIMK